MDCPLMKRDAPQGSWLRQIQKITGYKIGRVATPLITLRLFTATLQTLMWR